MEKLDIFTLDLLGKSFLEWGKSFENQVEIFTPAGIVFRTESLYTY